MPDENRDISPVISMIVSRLDGIESKIDRLSADQIARVSSLETRQETHSKEIGDLRSDVSALKGFRSNLRGQLTAAAAAGGIVSFLATMALKALDAADKLPH
mgnify:FL=1